MTGIYKIQNMLNNKKYIGKAEDIERRFAQHKYALKNFSSSWYPEARAESTSIEDFTFEVIQQCKLDELDELEEYWIYYYNSHITDYNKKYATSGMSLLTDGENIDQNLGFISLDVFRAINSKLDGKCGNARALLLYLIMLFNNKKEILPLEEEILNYCKFDHSAYVRARQYLVKNNLIEYSPSVSITIKFSNIIKT